MTVPVESRLVLHVIDSLGRVGGAEEQLIENLRRFTDRRLRHRILCLYERVSDERSGEVPEGVEVGYLYRPGDGGRSRPQLVAKLVRAIRGIDPDLVHCALPNAALGSRLAGRLLGIPVIESLVNISHEPIRTVDNPAVVRWKLGAHRLLDRLTMRSVARFQALSQAVATSWIETVGIRPERVSIIPRGVNLERFAATPDEQRRMIRASLGVADDAFVLLNIGRQVAQKGQIYALRALPAVLRELPATVMLSAGTEGPMTGRLQDEAALLGVADRVHWLGVRSDIPDLLAASDVFVFPSLYEGLGVSLLEAMAAGVAPITTETPPMSEVVVHGHTGVLVPPRDPGMLAEAIVELGRDSDRRAAIGQNARLHIAHSFASNATAAQVETMYQATLGLGGA